MKQEKLARWTAYVVAFILFMTGVPKLLLDSARENFPKWGYPENFAYVIGAAEILTAVLLVVHRTRFWGAGAATVIMIGAAVAHLSVPEVGLLPLGIPTLAASLFIAWTTAPAWARKLTGRPTSSS